MVWIWSSSKLEKYVRRVVDTQIRKFYKTLLKKLEKKSEKVIEYDPRGAIRLQVKQQLEEKRHKFQDEVKAELSEFREFYLQVMAAVEALGANPSPVNSSADRAFRADIESVIREIGKSITENSDEIKVIEKQIKRIIEFLASEEEIEPEKKPSVFDGMMNLGDVSKIMKAGGPQKEMLLKLMMNAKVRKYYGAGLGGLHGTTMKGPDR